MLITDQLYNNSNLLANFLEFMFYYNMGISSAFTKTGNRLVTKMVKEVVSDAHPCIRHLENIPKGAKTFDLAVIERKFGKERLGIFSFRDKDGKLIQRISEQDGDKKLVTISNYVYKTLNGSHIREITRRILDGKKLVKDVFDNISVNAANRLSLSKTSLKREFGQGEAVKSKESSLYGFFEVNKKPVKLIVNSQRHNDNTAKITGFQYSGMTKDEAKELAKDPYLTMRLLPMDDFTVALKPMVYRNNDIARANIRTYKANLGKDIQAPLAMAQRGNNGEIKILLNRQRNELHSKPCLVDAFNHEGRHCRQYIATEQLEYTKNFPYRSGNYLINLRQKEYGILDNPESIRYAEEMKKGMDNYVSAADNPAAYRSNALEVDARRFGESAKTLYISFANKLKSKIALTYKQLGLLD